MANNRRLAELARLPETRADYNLRVAGTAADPTYTWTQATGGGGSGTGIGVTLVAAFPTTPALNQRVKLTTTGRIYYYNGNTWVGESNKAIVIRHPKKNFSRIVDRPRNMRWNHTNPDYII